MAERLIEEQIAEFKTAFNGFDKDNDGYLDIKELGELLHSLGQVPTEAERQEIMATTSVTLEKIDFGDFLYLMTLKMKHTDMEQELINAFKVFDRDGNGNISTQELKYVMSNVGETMTDEEIDMMIQEADGDRDGQINYHEFISMMISK